MAAVVERCRTLTTCVPILPAIDLVAGRVVSLSGGDPTRQIVLSEDPVAVATYWQEQGADWLHVVDIEGSLTGQPANLAALGAILRSVSIPVEVGGGLRTLADAEWLLEAGARRLLVGTVADEDPTLFESFRQAFGDRVVPCLDTRGGRLTTRGWTKTPARAPDDLVAAIQASGFTLVACTDAGRDGTLAFDRDGFWLSALRSGLGVVVAGGVGSLDDLRYLSPFRAHGLRGVVVGRALHSGVFTLEQAQTALNAG